MNVAICMLTLLAQLTGEALPALTTLSATTGGIKAEVRDAAGAPVPKVRIRIKHRDGRVWETTTDAKGRFLAGGLPPGDYELASHREGFAGEVRVIKIRANAWLLGVTGDAPDRRPSKGRVMRFFGPPIYEAPNFGLKTPAGPGVENIPMH